jgi:hypothetical protein
MSDFSRRSAPRRSGSRLFVTVGAVTILAWSGIHGAPTVEAGGVDNLLGRRPFVRLFTEANSCTENAQLNGLSPSRRRTQLARLTRWYVHFHGEASNAFPLGVRCKGASRTTLAQKLSSLGAMVSNYRNGSYVSQSAPGLMNFHEARGLERNAPLAIATFWPGQAGFGRGSRDAADGRLLASISRRATSIRVVASPGPSGAPATWPYIASRGSGLDRRAYSRNTHDFVSWIRVGNELMKVVAAPTAADGVITLSVRRGLWSSDASPHPSDARVMSPVYVGGDNGGFDGSPSADSTQLPLRYGIKIWTASGVRWIAARIRNTLGKRYQGYNAVWLDITSCGLSNTVSATGPPIVPWDDRAKTPLTSPRWGEYQEDKVAGLRRRLDGLRWFGNSLHWTTPCNLELLGTSLQGGALEKWLNNNESWADAVQQSLVIQRRDLAGIYWARWNQGVADEARYKRFTYGSLLLTYRSSADRFQYGGPWGLAKPERLFFWDLGRPITNPNDLAELRAPSGLYLRRFSNGLVVVNPTANSLTTAVGAGYLEVSDLTGAQPTPVDSVTVASHDAAFLMRP